MTDSKSYSNEPWILAATILASSMAFIDGSALNTALAAVQAGLGASGAQLLWVVNAYLLMLAALILVGGSLGDRLGRKKVFMTGISLFMLASLACGLAPSIGWLIAARVVQGIGGALMIPGSLSLLTASVAPEPARPGDRHLVVGHHPGDRDRPDPGRHLCRSGFLAGRVPDQPAAGDRWRCASCTSRSRRAGMRPSPAGSISPGRPW